MRVLVSALGTIGDVHPMLAIATAMRDRGHEVFLLANPTYEKLATEAQVRFEPIGKREDLDRIKSHPKAFSYAHGWKLWFRGTGVESMRELYDRIDQLNRPNETVIAAHYLSFGARVARERLGIPTATVHLNVHTIRSAHHIHAYPPPSFLPDCLPRGYLLPSWMPPWYRLGTLNWADRLFIDPVLSKEICAFRAELGLPKLRRFIRRWWNSPDLVLGLFPSWWTGYHPDWPARVVMTGFPQWQPPKPVSINEELRLFLDSAQGVIVFTPGASANHTDKHFSAFARACQAVGRKGLIITPKQPTGNYDAYQVRFQRFVPFDQLLPHAALVVHHAGIGTAAACLAHGLPQVVIPTLYNEPDTAIRLERLGVARQVSARWFNRRKLISAIDQALNSAEIRAKCEKFAALMRDTQAMACICPQLESLLAKADRKVR